MFYYVLIPLIIFTILESFGKLRLALIAAILSAIAESAYSYYYYKSLDSFSIATIILVMVMASLAYYK